MSAPLASSPAEHPDPRHTCLFLLAFFLLLLPFCFLGYGSDNDTYGVLEAGRSTWLHHHLYTSRHPGYWTYEFVVFLLSSVGGYVLSNLGSLIVATLVLWRLIVLSARLGCRHPLLLTTSLAATPVFVVAATSTIDYVWSLLCIILMAEALAAHRPWRAMLFGALAIAFRAANGILVAGGFGLVLLDELLTHRSITPRARNLALAGLLSAILGGLPLVASAYTAHWTSDWTVAYMGPADMWILPMRAGRFVYKGLYLFGPLATLLLAVLLLLHLPSTGRHIGTALADPRRRTLTLAAFGLLLGNVYLFWRFPIEVSYAIPGAFFLLLLASETFLQGAGRGLLTLLALCIVSLNVVLFELAQPNISGHATNAKLTFHVTEGTTWQDVHDRLIVRSCRTNQCWIQQLGTLPAH